MSLATINYHLMILLLAKQINVLSVTYNARHVLQMMYVLLAIMGMNLLQMETVYKSLQIVYQVIMSSYSQTTMIKTQRK